MMKFIIIGLFLSAISTTINAQEIKQDSVGFEFDTIAMVPTTPVRSQYKSGTCWSFATTSFIETEALRLTGKSVDISEMYFVYFAYQAKAKSYIRLHGKSNFSGGGQAHDVMNVVAENGMLTEKDFSGIVPGYDDHVHGELDIVLSNYLKGVKSNKAGHLSNAWQTAYTSLLNTYLGNPSSELLVKKAKNLTKELKINADDYIELTSYKYKDYYQPIRLEVPDNWSFDNYYNIPLDEMMKLIQGALKDGYSVCWDGDVSSKGFSHKNGLAILPETEVKNMAGSEQSRWEKMTDKELNKNMYKFKGPVPEKKVTEESRQLAFDNYTVTDDHLMHLTGLLKDQNGTLYYVTKNSWDDDSNDNGGYLSMSDAFLRMNTVAIMVHKDAIPKALREKLGIK